MAIAELFKINPEGKVTSEKNPQLLKRIIFTNAKPSIPDEEPGRKVHPDLPNPFPERQPVGPETPAPVEKPIVVPQQPVPVRR